ncbi:MAG: response regulator [Chloroflexi bacterium]|jgi:CheY-like chemotaxis protein|nr:response regulator [Chloroflexota bacterium]
MATLHALIIDDDAYSIHVMERLLDQEDISYTAVADPTRLEGILQTLDTVDIVFLDLEMPKLDGYEVLAMLKTHLTASVPIVACTVHTAEINNTRRKGFFSFVAKPLDLDRFSDQLHRILSGIPVWEAR